MSKNRPHEELLITNGFYFIGSCRCEGTLCNDYKKEKTILKIYPESGYCRIKGNQSRTKLDNINELIESI